MTETIKRVLMELKIRAAAAKTPEYLQPQAVSIRRWTAAYHGDESRTDWITRQIIEKIEKDSSTADGCFLNSGLEISLDETGIINHFETLTEFFGDAETLAVYRDFKSRNELCRFYEDTRQAVPKMPLEKRKKLFDVWRTYKPQDRTGKEVRKNMLDIIKNGLR